LDKTPVGVLDEAFVAEHGEIGTKFVEGGSVWKIRQVYRNKIYVEPEKNPLGAIPTWIGDEIPVPFEVASEVGTILGEVETRLKNKEELDTIAEDLAERYAANKETLQRALRPTEEQVRLKEPVPTDRLITLERWGEYVVLQAPFGHRINRALARVIGHLLTIEIGASVGVQQDPYRIVLKTRQTRLKMIEVLLKKIGETDLESLAIEATVKTGLFKRRFLHVAKKFGAVEKDADLSGTNIEDIIDGLRETAIFKESVKTVLREDIDHEGAARLAHQISAGEIGIATLGELDEPSPIARIGLEEIGRKTDIIPPARMRQILHRSTRARLLNEVVTTVCTECWDYVDTKKVIEMQEATCPECGSQKIGFTTDPEESVHRLSESMRVDRGKPPKRFRRMARRITGSAEIYLEYGFPAAVVLAGRGIRPSEAKEILQHDKVISERLIEQVLEAEKRALRRRYSV
jgi:ATP-dependent Lhr-like helicase